MLRNKNRVDPSSFIEMFDKKFTNFCSKNILDLEFSIYPDNVVIEDHSGMMPEPLTYEFNFNKALELNIYEIRQQLTKFYPKLYSYREKTYNKQELEALLSKHSLSEVTEMMGKEEKVLHYTVFRVINDKNEINVIDHLDYNRKKVYTFSIPVMDFVDKCYSNPSEALSLLKRKAKYKHVL